MTCQKHNCNAWHELMSDEEGNKVTKAEERRGARLRIIYQLFSAGAGCLWEEEENATTGS